MGVRQQSKHEYLARLQPRYLKAGRKAKGALLDEAVRVTEYHRRHVLRLLRHGRFPDPAAGAARAPAGVTGAGRAARAARGGRPRVYSPAVVGALRVAAEASGWLCGKRLAPFLGELVPALEAEGLVRLTEAERGRLLGMSAATVDRRLRPYRLARDPKNWHGLGTTKPGTLLRDQVPVKTYTPWEDQRPGFCEVDLVAHCGPSGEGTFLHTLVLTDVATGWTECVAAANKSQRAVFAALEVARERLPFALLGLDSDNGSEFLNSHLVRWCRQHQITFTRSRPYWKNDQAHVEQKNWSVVRRLVGYGRYESPEALAVLRALYERLRLWTNLWQPSLKLVAKQRDDRTGKTRKRYDTARTPYRRALVAGALSEDHQRALDAARATTSPVRLRRELATWAERLARHQKRPNELGDLGNVS